MEFELQLELELDADLRDPLNQTAGKLQHAANTSTLNPVESEYVWALFGVLYGLIFLLGIAGNMVVLITVFSNKHMHTVTNFLITNLAMSDILTDCITVPFTPAVMLMDGWIFGQLLCRIFGMASAVSIYVSTLTSTVIAIDRYFVITHPLLPRMTTQVVGAVIVATWLVACLISLPIGIYQQTRNNTEDGGDKLFCMEQWPDESDKTVFDLISTVLQFVAPCGVIGCCYANVWIALRRRNAKRAKRTTQAARSSEREELEMRRNRKMTVLFVSIISYFIVSWLPFNVYHVANFTSVFWFLACHLVAMTGTVVNPFLYAFFNENFRKEFGRLFSCAVRRDPQPHAQTHTQTQTQTQTQTHLCRNADAERQSACTYATVPALGTALEHEHEHENEHDDSTCTSVLPPPHAKCVS